MLMSEYFRPSDPAKTSPVQVDANFALPEVSVIPPPRNMDPDILAWKGLAVQAQLDSMQELWVRKADWDTLGYRALKEKAYVGRRACADRSLFL